MARAGTFVSGTPGAALLAGGLALAAALLLASGAARAADECGALDAGNSFTRTCGAAEYPNGIVYWGETNSITLTVPGTAATTTITTGASNMQDSGIAVRTTAHASEARNINLVVGGTGPVEIVQDGTTTQDPGSRLSRGIFVDQQSGNGATTRVEVKRDVTIGSSDAMVNGSGLNVGPHGDPFLGGMGVYGTRGYGDVTVINEADIYATRYGIAVDSHVAAATAATSVINRGDIKVGREGDAILWKEGIAVWGSPTARSLKVRNEGDIDAVEHGVFALSGGTTVSVTNLGVIEAGNSHGIAATHNGATGALRVTNSNTISAGWNGIFALSIDKDSAGADGDITVTHSDGAISAPSLARTRTGDIEGGHGIRVIVGADRQEADPDHAGYVAPVNTGLAEVSVTGGSIRAQGDAIEAINYEAGSVQVAISAGVTVTSKQRHGIQAQVTDAGNTAGKVEITQGGTIAGRTGVDAAVLRASATGETRGAEDQPLIDVTWTGGFSHGTTATVAPNDDDRLTPMGAMNAVAVAQEVEAEKAMRPARGSGGFLRYGSPAGIEARVMSWREVMTAVAKGDDPGEFTDSAAALEGADGPALRAAFKAVLANDDLDHMRYAARVDADGDGTYSDTEIDTYLGLNMTPENLRNVLAQSFTEAERAVLRAVATGTGLDDALANEDAGFSDDYKTAVRDLLKRFNVGDIRIAIDGGSIDSSRGDGIRAYYATPNADNGAISVTIAAGTTVTGGMAGIYVANAGVGTDGILKQTVTVRGTVTGGRDTAVHLSGGGRLTVGEMGRVLAGSSGVGVLVNDPGPAHITIDGLVRGAEGGAAAVHLTGGGSVTVGPRGRVQANGAARAIRSDDEPTSVIVRTSGDGLTPENVREAAARIEGRIGGNIASPTESGPNGMSESGTITITVAETVDDGVIGRVPTGGVRNLRLDKDGNVEPGDQNVESDDQNVESDDQDEFKCSMAAGGYDQCRLYEALPSVLLAMNDLPTWAERMSAARDGKGGWARVETARGEWKADSSTRPDVAYDHRRHGVRAGMDFAVGEAGRVGRAGVSVHGLLGSAEMASPMGGNDKIELSGRGLGVNATAALAGDVHVDAQAAVTWYDVDLELATGRSLKKGAKGMGYALGVEVVGRRMPVTLPVMDGVSVTPRGGLLWSKVSLDDFTQEMEGSTVRPRISVEDADSLAGRVGVMVEGAVGSEDAPGRVFGSVDVEREFKDETSVNVTGNRLLETTARSNGVRLGLGGELAMREDAVLRARADYTTRGGDTNEYGVGVELSLRF